jgi:hypothetical protein
VAGSALAVLLPIGAGGGVWAWRRGRRALGLAAAPACLLAAAALLLTASRGAWLGLAAGGAIALAVQAAPAGRPSAIVRTVALVLVLLLVAAPLLAAVAAGPAVDRVFGSVSAPGLALTRPAIWRDALALIGDTPFTGSGLGGTAMIYSSYALLIHAPFITQVHNLLLQIAVEQGLPGLAVCLVLLAAALWGLLAGAPSGGSARALWLASLVSLVALAVHGAVDAALYASKAAPTFFLPLGMAFGAAMGLDGRLAPSAGRPADRGGRSSRLWGARGWAALGLAGAAALLLLPGSQAAFQANLGAVAQARAELAAFRPPETPIQDALRRDGTVDLAPAEARYRAALALDPANVTANRRLGQIELSRGEHEAARGHLAAAYAAAPGQRGTRLLLGESYAAAGDVTEAARLWSGLEGTDVALAERAWWYGFLGQPESAEAIRQAAMGRR